MTDKKMRVPLDDIQFNDHLNYIERMIEIIDRKTNTLCNKAVDLLNVHWQQRNGSEWALEPEKDTRTHYPNLFTTDKFEGEIRVKWGIILTSLFQVLISKS